MTSVAVYWTSLLNNCAAGLSQEGNAACRTIVHDSTMEQPASAVEFDTTPKGGIRHSTDPRYSPTATIDAQL